MDNQLPELRVNMLGRFSITYGDQPITFKRNSATKAVKLLQILLHSSLTENQGNGGISRAQLLDDLIGREELANVGNNLRVTVFRLRKMLIEAGLPEYDYIVKEKGVFYWRSPMKTDLDVVRFVAYPGLESHLHHKVAASQLARPDSGFGGVLSFGLDTDHDGHTRFVSKLNVITSAVSLGHD